MTNITLVGTVHSDFKGPERLRKILRFYRDPVIALESTPEDAQEAKEKIVGHRRLIEDTIKKNKGMFTEEQIASLRAYVNSYVYESNIPYDFQKQNQDALVVSVGVVVENLDKWMEVKVSEYISSGGDVSRLTGMNNPTIEDLLANGIEVYQRAIDQAYAQDGSGFMKELMGEIFPYLTDKRDKIFAERIRELRKEHSEREVVGIFGNMHVFGKYERNLYEQLSDLNPTRVRLNEADNF